jgi:methylenetetrahydrofolate dehydrogenase (NADP+)/methenyltetrahydrofolate cyclohydrolase
MTARIIDGKSAAAALRARVAVEVARFRAATGRAPGLAVVLVGDDPASAVYVRSKGKATVEAGMLSFEHNLPAGIGEGKLIDLIEELNTDPAVDGILVQLPLPDHIDANQIITAIDPGKDVDGFHPINAGRLAIGLPGFIPCTPLGCLKLLKAELGNLSGKDAVVIGRSNIVGRPMALELLMARCTVTVCHSATRDLPALVRQGDIVVAAMGKPGFVQGDWIRDGAIVIDVGINRGADGKLVGDVDFAGARERAAWITPVPGGVGPMTIATLLANTLRAAELQDAANRKDAV